MLRPGDLLGDRYKVESVLGSGGMGVVYRAVDRKLGQTIALKVLRSGSASFEDLKREIVLARRVTHENVCRIYDLEEIDGYECVSMEFIDGESLFDLRHRLGSSFPVGRGLDFAKQICRGLAAAHRTGVVHRDLKPENILIDSEGRARIMDFGIAAAADLGTPEAPGTIVGTPQFMPPERLRGEPVDVRGDIYSLGVIFFEMFTGRLPFDADDIAALAAKVAFDPPPSPREFNPEVPEEIAMVLLRCLSKKPEERYVDVLDLLKDFERGEGLIVDQILNEMSLAKARLVRLLSVLEANKTVSAALDVDRILSLILEVATKEIGADRGTIFLVDSEGEALLSRVLAGGSVKEIRIPIASGIAGAVATTGQRVVIDDAYKDSRFNQSVDRETGYRTKNLIAVPMRNPKGTIVGVLELLNKPAGPFSPADAEFLEDVSVHAAVALENARRHTEAVAAARIDARNEASAAIFRALDALSGASASLVAARDGATGGGSPGLFAARRLADGSIGFLFATDDGEPLEAGLRLLRLGQEFQSLVIDGLFSLPRLREAYGRLGVPFGPGGPRAIAGRIEKEGRLFFEPAGHPSPAVIANRGGELTLVRPSLLGNEPPPVLEPGDVLFLFDEDLIALPGSDGQPLGDAALFRFLASEGASTPLTVVEAAARLVSIYGGFDRGRRRWFAAAFSPKAQQA
jgi:putative methionine-R-sulfoxide reductase with GAF domain/predicted Ser/Thr protein kinase